MLAFPLIPVLIIGLLIFANAFFAAAEFALVSVRRTWLQQKAAQGNVRAETALKLVGNLNGVVSGTQLAITMISLALGWVGENTIAELIQPVLISIGIGSFVVIHGVALSLAFLSITVLHLVLGELVPKQVALARAERLSLLVARPMSFFLTIVRRPLHVLHTYAFAMARRLGAKQVGHTHQIYSAEELKLLVSVSFRSGELPAYQQEMIHNIIDMAQVPVREVMVPRPNIVSVPVHLSLEELSQVVTEDQHSRIPVYEGSPEHIIGVLYTKDLLRVLHEERSAGKAGGESSTEFSLRSLAREVPVVPETKPIDQLLQEFQQRRRHMALVVDEFGNTVGLVTVEDLLEQIVGEIEDEYDREIPPGRRVGERTLVLDARVSLLDLENQYEVQLPRDEGFETLAGFVLQQFGHIPKAGESFVYGDRRFTVLEAEDHRVAAVKLEKLG